MVVRGLFVGVLLVACGESSRADPMLLTGGDTTGTGGDTTGTGGDTTGTGGDTTGAGGGGGGEGGRAASAGGAGVGGTQTAGGSGVGGSGVAGSSLAQGTGGAPPDIAYRSCGEGLACEPRDSCGFRKWEWAMNCTCNETLQYACTYEVPAGLPPESLLCAPMDCTMTRGESCYVKESGCDYSVTCMSGCGYFENCAENVYTIEGSCPEADENR
jgi:hypothetical protein